MTGGRNPQVLIVLLPYEDEFTGKFHVKKALHSMFVEDQGLPCASRLPLTVSRHHLESQGRVISGES